MSSASEPLPPSRSRWRSASSRLGIPLLLVVGHLCAGLFLYNLDHSLSQIRDPSVRMLSQAVFLLYSTFLQSHPVVALLVMASMLWLLWRSLRGRPIRWAIDLIGVMLCVRCGLQFLLLNLLLLAPLRNGELLLIQLLLFLPVITVSFGWLYWRLDTGAQKRGQRHLRFEDESLGVGLFDYLLTSVRSLLQLEPAGATPVSRLMKSLFVLHGIVMLDLMALTLSRAIGLASGAG